MQAGRRLPDVPSDSVAKRLHDALTILTANAKFISEGAAITSREPQLPYVLQVRPVGSMPCSVCLSGDAVAETDLVHRAIFVSF